MRKWDKWISTIVFALSCLLFHGDDRSAFGDERIHQVVLSTLPIRYLRTTSSLHISSQGMNEPKANLSSAVSLSVICENGKDEKFQLALRENIPSGWQPAKPVRETVETKTIYGDKYSIPVRLISESGNSVLEYDLVDFPGAPWREDGKCGACKCDGACGNACTVTIPSHFVSESLDPSRWAGLEYQVKPTVLKAGKPNVVELSATVKATELLEKPVLTLNLNQTVAKPVAAKPGAAKDGCGSGCGGGGGGCGEHSSSTKAVKTKAVLSMEPSQWGKDLKVASDGCGGGCGGGCGSGDSEKGTLTKSLSPGTERITLKIAVTPTQAGKIEIPNMFQISGTLKDNTILPKLTLLDANKAVIPEEQIRRMETTSFLFTSGLVLQVKP